MAAIFHGSCLPCSFLMAVVRNHLSIADYLMYGLLIYIWFQHFVADGNKEQDEA